MRWLDSMEPILIGEKSVLKSVVFCGNRYPRVDVRCRDELGVVRGRPVCARRLAAIARGRRGIVGRRSAAGQPRPCGGYTRNSEPREKLRLVNSVPMMHPPCMSFWFLLESNSIAPSGDRLRLRKTRAFFLTCGM